MVYVAALADAVPKPDIAAPLGTKSPPLELPYLGGAEKSGKRYDKVEVSGKRYPILNAIKDAAENFQGAMEDKLTKSGTRSMLEYGGEDISLPVKEGAEKSGLRYPVEKSGKRHPVLDAVQDIYADAVDSFQTRMDAKLSKSGTRRMLEAGAYAKDTASIELPTLKGVEKSGLRTPVEKSGKRLFPILTAVKEAASKFQDDMTAAKSGYRMKEEDSKYP